jgi:glycosyltransferase involved in cell wall biosynthesis
MNNRPLVTIMIPTYNQAAFLTRAIDSAIAQDYPNMEIVVSDDNSTDNTTGVITKYADKVRISRNQTNLGRVGNYKHTLENLARGEWVINLDGDDYFTDNGYISYCVDLANKRADNIMFVQGGHDVVSSDGKLIARQHALIPGEYMVQDGAYYFLHFHFFSHLATLYRRTEAIKLDFYRYDILSTDIESFLRLALNGKVILTKRIAGVWLHHGSNESRKLTTEVVEKNMLRITGPYDHAKAINAIREKELDNWKKRKTRSYLLQYATVYLKDKRAIPGYLNFIMKKYNAGDLLVVIPLAILRSTLTKLFRQRRKYGNN